jgi:hypothetical protein
MDGRKRNRKRSAKFLEGVGVRVEQRGRVLVAPTANTTLCKSRPQFTGNSNNGQKETEGRRNVVDQCRTFLAVQAQVHLVVTAEVSGAAAHAAAT